MRAIYLFAIAAIFLFASCGGNNQKNKVHKIAKGGVKYGGYFRCNEQEYFKSLFPLNITESVGDHIVSQIYEGLVNFNATGFLKISVTARLESGNTAPGFIINLFDGDGSGTTALTATFSASNFNSVSFTTGTALLTVHPEMGNAANIQYFGISGTGTAVPFRVSFDSISVSAIPEPGTYAALTGLLVLGFAAWRRRAGPA